MSPPMDDAGQIEYIGRNLGHFTKEDYEIAHQALEKYRREFHESKKGTKIMKDKEIEENVKEIIEKHVDVSHASLDYKAKLAKAISVMAAQILEYLSKSPRTKGPFYPCYNINSLDYGGPHIPMNDTPRDFTVSRYEDEVISHELNEFVERIDPEAMKEDDDEMKHEFRKEDYLTRAQKNQEHWKTELALVGFFADRLWREAGNNNDHPLDYVDKAKEILQSLEDECEGKWDYATAEKIYKRFYRMKALEETRAKKIDWRRMQHEALQIAHPELVAENEREEEIQYDDDELEYDIRMATEEIYENWCLGTGRPFIVLTDLFYDILEYRSPEHMMGYRYRAIGENTLYYAKRYRSEENAWFWESIDKAWELRSRYHDEDIGLCHNPRVSGTISRCTLPYYLFSQHLALLRYTCEHLTDEAEKHEKVVKFVVFQFRGHGKYSFTGFPRMYADICAYIGVTPVNLAAYEETEKEVQKRYDEEEQRILEGLKRNDRDRVNTADVCLGLIYSDFHSNIKEFAKMCEELKPMLVAAEKKTFLEEEERHVFLNALMTVVRKYTEDAEPIALRLMQMYVNIVHMKDRKETTEVADEYDYYEWEESKEIFAKRDMSSDAAVIFNLIKSLMPSLPEWIVKQEVLIIEERLEKIQGYYQSWTFEAHNSLWNEINNLQYRLNIPAEGRDDGTLSYLDKNDKENVWSHFAPTIYEAYCKRLGILPLDFAYTIKEERW